MAAEPRPTEALPEVAAVGWRPRMDEARLRRHAQAWWGWTAAHLVVFLGTAVIVVLVEPWLFPMALIALGFAWVLPELYANRGANVIRPRPRTDEAAERTALGLLGDLVDHDARQLHARTGLVREPGRFGTWLVGEAGALLVRGRTVHCFCVRVNQAGLPSADRIAHLLLALRADEAAFATVANRAFAGARWRVRRRMPKRMRPALDAVGHKVQRET